MSNHSVLNSYHAGLKQEMGREVIIKECIDQLSKHFHFELMAFMLIDEEDQSFQLFECVPADQRDHVQKEIDKKIENGVFAWALNQNKPVFEKTLDNRQTLVFRALSTRFRIRGMFCGITDINVQLAKDGSLNLLSVIIESASNTLENHELYQCIHQHNRELEQTISQRTAELEKARMIAEKANQAKSQFLANISHEIRTPLTAILGYADLLRYQQLKPEEQALAVNDILRASSHLSNVINDILDISKIEANKLEIEVIPTSLIQLLDTVASIVQGAAKEKDLSFRIDYAFPLPKCIDTDPTRLKQILLNLCSNATKFTESGEISITVSYHQAIGSISFQITDTGIGISAEQQKKLFQKFVQADSSITRRYGGTGLGLAICKQLAYKLGGEISVQSTLGQGSCFRLTLKTEIYPETDLMHSYAQLPKEKNNNPWETSEKLYGHVLLAEDNPNNQKLFSLYLSKAGITVEIVDNGNDAVEKALVNSYDLILMDMQMPAMNGLEATKMLRSVGYDGAIILLTANSTVEIRQQCHDAGCDGFLSKPIELEPFFSTLQQFLKTDVGSDTSITHQDPDFQNILKDFLGTLPQTLTDMETALEQNNWRALKSLAHQLKGVAGGYGYPDMGETARRIETLAEDESNDEIRFLLQKLQNDSENLA